ncbi:MAG: gliding motility lipoprotein GldH [Flavobacteriales bacterium]
MRRLTAQLAMVALLLLTSCGPEAIINESHEIPNGEWVFENGVQFSAEIVDTLQPVNYYIQVRHSGNYAYRNLIVYFKTFYPNNTYMVDTINCPLAEPSGKWLGSGLGDMLDNRILFKINQRFPMSGGYNFEIQHAMRPDIIHEVYDVGLLIEKAKN